MPALFGVERMNEGNCICCGNCVFFDVRTNMFDETYFVCLADVRDEPSADDPICDCFQYDN